MLFKHSIMTPDMNNKSAEYGKGISFKWKRVAMGNRCHSCAVESCFVSLSFKEGL